MTDAKSPAAIERHAEEVRQEMADTAEHLRKRLSPGELFDEVTSYLRHSDGAASFSNLRVQARENPMALALVGTGLAWLMFGSGAHERKRHSRHDREYARSPYGRFDTSHRASPVGETGDQGRSGRSAGAAVSEAVSGAGDTAKDYAHSMREGASEAYDQASSGVDAAYRGARHAASDLGTRFADSGHDAMESMSHLADRASAGGRDAAERARHAFDDLIEREPLIVGAIGLAVGAALGALAPHTKIEDEYLGEAGDRMRHSAAAAAREGLDEAKQVVEKSYAAGKETLRQESATKTSSATTKEPDKSINPTPRSATSEVSAAKPGKTSKGTGRVT